MNKAHKNNTKAFCELSFIEQMNSIKIQIVNLEKQIHNNIELSILEQKNNPNEGYILMLNSIIESIK